MTDLSPLLRIRDAHVRRAGREILAVDEFSLAEGESAALLGPNGSGKSTFIGLITREIHPLHRDEAPVLFRGDARVTLADIKRALGVVSSTMQDQIRVHVPAQDIVAGGLFGSLGIPQRCTVTDGQRARARAIMSELGIGDLAERDILTLSTGQARRVLIARALVHDPDVLIFDEPCTGLDPEGMYYVRQTMSALARAGPARAGRARGAAGGHAAHAADGMPAPSGGRGPRPVRGMGRGARLRHRAGDGPGADRGARPAADGPLRP